MIEFDDINTDHEKIDMQAQRIHRDAWEEYGELSKRHNLGRLYQCDLVKIYDENFSDSMVSSGNRFEADHEIQFSVEYSGGESKTRISDVRHDRMELLRQYRAYFSTMNSLTGTLVGLPTIWAFAELPEIQSIVRQSKASRRRIEEIDWNEEKNDRRCELIDKKIEGLLDENEKQELEDLQNQMLAFRRKVAPLPLQEVRELHQELMMKAAQKRG